MYPLNVSSCATRHFFITKLMFSQCSSSNRRRKGKQDNVLVILTGSKSKNTMKHFQGVKAVINLLRDNLTWLSYSICILLHLRFFSIETSFNRKANIWHMITHFICLTNLLDEPCKELKVVARLCCIHSVISNRLHGRNIWNCYFHSFLYTLIHAGLIAGRWVFSRPNTGQDSEIHVIHAQTQA